MKIGETIYLDHQATTPLDSRVYDAMAPFYRHDFGNPHSVDHAIGWKANLATQKAAEQVAEMIGADPDEIVFTSGATEANNAALLGIAKANKNSNRTRVLIAQTEHKCTLEVGRVLERDFNLKVTLLPVDPEGSLCLNTLDAELSSDVLIVSIMAVNNEIGTIQNIPEIAQRISQYGALFHCDAAQAPCAINMNGLAEHVDMLSLSSHKIYGPMGIGALFIKRSIQNMIEPLVYGGGQQRNLRSGTLPTALCVGFGTASHILASQDAEKDRMLLAKLTNKFQEELKKLPFDMWINGPSNLKDRHPGNINVGFEGIDSADFLGRIQPKLAASTGSACTSGTPEASHVLQAIGLTETKALSCVRFSLGRFTMEADLIEATNIIRSALEDIKQENLLITS